MTENGAATGYTPEGSAGNQTPGQEKKSPTKSNFMSKMLKVTTTKGGKETTTNVDFRALPKNTAICRKQLTDGTWMFDQEIGTTITAVGRRFISFISFSDEGCETGKWIMGLITSRGTKESVAIKSKFRKNWHNFVVERILSEPLDWEPKDKDRERSINLKKGTMWCILENRLNEQGLNITITTVPSESEQETPATDRPKTDITEDEEEEQLDLVRETEGEPPTKMGDTERWVQDQNGGKRGEGEVIGDEFLPTTNELENEDMTDIRSETSGFTMASLSSSISSSAWVKSEGEIKPYITGLLICIELYDQWIARIEKKTGTDREQMKIRKMKEQATQTLIKLFAVGCLVNRRESEHPVSHSQEYAEKHWSKKPIKSLLKALRTTKRSVKDLQKLLYTLSEGEETSDTKIAQWVDFKGNDEDEPMLNPAEILEEDSIYLDACIQVIESRVNVEMEAYKTIHEEVGPIKVKSLSGSKEDKGGGEINGVKTTTTGEKVSDEREKENPKIQNSVSVKSLSINDEHEVLSVNRQLKNQDLMYKQMKENYEKQAEENRILMTTLQRKLENMEIEQNKKQNERKKRNVEFLEENRTSNNESRMIGETEENSIEEMREQYEKKAEEDRLIMISLQNKINNKEGEENKRQNKKKEENKQDKNKTTKSENLMLGETEHSRIKEMRELIDLQIEKKHRWIFLEPITTWRKYLSNGTDWLINNPMNRTMEILMETTVTPIWAMDIKFLKELSEFQAAYNNLLYAENEVESFLLSKPVSEDEIKSLLKIHQHKHDITDKLRAAQTFLLKTASQATHLPIILISAVKVRAGQKLDLFDKYIRKLEEVQWLRREQGITLNPTSQTVSQTEDQLKNFSGMSSITYPQWKNETLATLGASGVQKKNWLNLVVKKIVSPARGKISQEAIASKEIEKVFKELERYYDNSYAAISTLTSLHLEAGPIPDPDYEMQQCVQCLTAHNEILSGTQSYLKYSNSPDKEHAVYTTQVCQQLILLLPDKVRRENVLFYKLTDGSFERNKMRYEAFSTWVKEMRDRLLHMNADHPAIINQVHPVLITKEEIQDKGDEKLDELISAVKVMTERFEGRNTRTTEYTGRNWTEGAKYPLGDPIPVDECRYCKVLLNHRSGTIRESTVYAELKKHKFNEWHKTWFLERNNRHMLSANGCLLWLHATIEQRVAAIKDCGTNIICKTCLAVPSRWNSGKTQCAGLHSIRKKEVGKVTQICIGNNCETHFTICKNHRLENKKHPLTEKAEEWVKNQTISLDMKGVGLSQEIVMLLQNDSPAIEVGNVAYSESEQEKVDEFLHNCSIASQFSVKSYATKEQEDDNVGVDEKEETTVLMTEKTWDEKELPEGVTMDKTKFFNENKNSISHEIIDRTEGTPVYLFIDLHGNNDRTVRTVFDSGAMVSVWLTSVIREGKLNSWIDRSTNTSIRGMGEGARKATNCIVRLPGNTKNPKTGAWVDYLSKSSMVEVITHPMRKTNQAELINKIINSAAATTRLPSDMLVSNFQLELGGTIEGLIGCRHLPEYPKPVFHLENGLSVYKHTLRQAGGRNKKYCLGGSLPAIQHFAARIGPEYQDMMVSVGMDNEESRSLLFGTLVHGTIRNAPLLTNREFREQQGEEDCRDLQYMEVRNSVLMGKDTQFFRVPASHRPKI